MLAFDNRVAIITGAGRGLGRAYAQALAQRGVKIVVNDFGGGRDGRDGACDPAHDVAKAIEQAGGDAMADAGDARDETAMDALVDKTLHRYGRIDIVINNAGILRDKSFAKMDMDDFRAVLDVHLMGSALLTRAAWPAMQEAGYGRVVFTTSSSGLYGNFGQANYAAAKLGLVGLMNALAIEGEKHGIHVNAIAPAAATRMTEELLPPQAAALLEPARVAPAVVYLCSEAAPTRKIIGAGAGVFATSHIVETEGQYLGAEATAEDLAAAFAAIDAGPQAPLGSAFEQTGKFVQAAMAAENSD